jgi:hypothetical protein
MRAARETDESGEMKADMVSSRAAFSLSSHNSAFSIWVRLFQQPVKDLNPLSHFVKARFMPLIG